jgi:hypothetical protein
MNELKTYDKANGISLLGEGIYVALDALPPPGPGLPLPDPALPGKRYSGALHRYAVLDGGDTGYCPPHDPNPTHICPRIGPIRKAPDSITVWATPAALAANGGVECGSLAEADKEIRTTLAAQGPNGYWVIVTDDKCLVLVVGLRPPT